MANTLLTPDMITREALRVLHQKCNFVGSINRQYDDSFAASGAKIGNTLRIRRPIEYVSATGATMATGTGADSVEQKFTLTVNTQRHVPMRFSSNELTMKLDDFSSRHIEPAMARLAAAIENDVLSMVSGVATVGANTQKGIYNVVNAGTKVEMADVLGARKMLVDNLAPATGLKALLDTQANVDLVDSLKGLFQDSSEIKKQYREGMLGRTAGFDFYENTLLPKVTTGTGAATSAYDVKGAGQVSTDTDVMSLDVDQGTKVLVAGQTFTIAGVNRVHPESKADTGQLQVFTIVGPATATGDTTIVISPGIVASGPRQNVSAAPANDAAITTGNAASTTYNQSLFFHPDAFVFASADLQMPDGLDWSSRQNYDGISMRMVRDYDIVKDRILARIDVLYGYRTMYRQLAARVLHT